MNQLNDTSSSPELPPELVGPAVCVLIYSFISLLAGFLTSWMVWVHHERTSYVALLSYATGLCTLASITQQIHTIAQCRTIKIKQYEYWTEHVGNPELALAINSYGLDLVLFYIQFYCYTVSALLLFTWAISLADSILWMRTKSRFQGRAGAAVKVAAFVLPAFTLSILRLDVIQSSPPAFFALANILMALGLCGTSVLLPIILAKYIQSRLQSTSWHVWYGRRSGRRSGSRSAPRSGTRSPGEALQQSQQSIYDKWLIMRFSVLFLVLGALELIIIITEIGNANRNTRAYLPAAPDLSVSRIRSDILFFLPGASTSLLIFVVFGTTRTFRAYMWETFVPARIRRRVAASHRRRRPASGAGPYSRSRKPPSAAAPDTESQQTLGLGDDIPLDKDLGMRPSGFGHESEVHGIA